MTADIGMISWGRMTRNSRLCASRSTCERAATRVSDLKLNPLFAGADGGACVEDGSVSECPPT